MNEANVLAAHSQTMNEKTLMNKANVTPQSKAHTIYSQKKFKENPQFKCFPTKLPCLNYLQTQPNLYLFGEDINSKLSKQFYAMDYQSIYQLSLMKKFHLYEYFEKGNQFKLFLDIDVKTDILDVTKQTELFEKVCQESINLILSYLKNYNIQNPEIIILSSCRENKVSSHIIFNNVVFEDIYAMQFFMSNIRSKLIDDDIIDLSVYKAGGLRMLWNSKFGINKNLEYHKGVNYTYTTNQQLFMDCLLLNVPPHHLLVKVDMPKNIKIMKKSRPNTTNHLIGFQSSSIVNQPISTIKRYLNLVEKSRGAKYKSWLEIGMVLHNCNPTEKCFELWDEWSKESESYSSRDFNAYKWNSFRFGYYSIGTLKYLAKQDNPEKYMDVEYSLEEPLFDSLKFESDYLLNTLNEKIKDKKSFVSQHIIDWATGKTKILSLKSTYDTGKTRIIYKIIKEFGFKKVLFISYRQTLTNELYGSFKTLNVESYLDKAYESERLICQIESLYKILPDYQFMDEDLLVPSYDLVIIDEIESVLNHFRSTTIDNKEKTFDLMKDIIYNSNKVLALDGDFHNRSYHYLKYFGDVIVLQNTIKKNIKHFIFLNDRIDFESQIEIALIAKKNIVIVSMSSSIATYFQNKYKDQYKTVLHCAKSDDANKEMLKDVNEFWIKYELVIYSPSIESGVNMDREHFDQIFVILSSKSTSPRGLMQMMSRVRKVKDNNVLIYLNNLPFKEKANFYTYDEVKEYIGEVYSKYLKPKTVLDPTIDKMVMQYHFDLYAQILVHNETENANKTRNLFVPYLIKLLTEKGHTYEYKQIRMNKKAFNKDVILKDEILKADDINNETFNHLLDKQINNEASREDKILIERFMLKKDWKVDEITNEFIEKYYGKTHVLINLRCLLDKSLVTLYMENQKGEMKTDFDGANKLEQIKMIDEVIKKIGFDKVCDGTKLDKGAFDKNIEKVKSECQLFTNINKSQPMFGYDKVKIGKISTVKQFMGFINSLFSEWGIVIKCVKNNKKVKGKVIKIISYQSTYLDNINQYI